MFNEVSALTGNKLKRRKTRTVKVGDLLIGGDHPIAIQSMTKAPLEDLGETLRQIEECYEAGASLMRVSVPDESLLDNFAKVVKRSPVPIVADVHFNPRIAIGVILRGASGLRLNPGNIADKEWLKRIAKELRASGAALRIGVNSGSLPKDLVEKMGRTPEAMVEAALRYVELMEELGVSNIKVSLKSSDPEVTVRANILFAERTDYPLHIGVTEAGGSIEGALRSFLALQKLIPMGIGDTVRISLSAPPVLEVRTATEILRLLDALEAPQVVACPTCGRLQVEHHEFFQLVDRISRKLAKLRKKVKVAIMGCVVNGPGEAGDSQVALMVGGKGKILLYKDGEVHSITTWDKAEEELMRLLQDI